MLRKVVLALFLFLSIFTYSQSAIGPNWQVGIGGGIVKFSDKDVSFIGDKHLSQIPRFNVTKRLNDKFSVDGALSFGSFDSETSFITKNNVPYFSFDVSARYKYIRTFERLDPFVFIGGSLVDSKRKMTPTINIGTGASYWLSENFGLSSQIYYKHSLESFESMRSHFQLTLGIIFGINFHNKRNGKGGTGCYYNIHK